MKTSDYVKAILNELSEHSPAIQDEQAERLVTSILSAQKSLWQVQAGLV